ncbi:MAG TPA: hypothetical protein VHL60_06070, partial [Oxalicibacterium sp.]|nr:hypothetical protein [Oxalicibacterium sp.]
IEEKLQLEQQLCMQAEQRAQEEQQQAQALRARLAVAVPEDGDAASQPVQAATPRAAVRKSSAPIWITLAAGLALMGGMTVWAFQNELSQWIAPHAQVAHHSSAAAITLAEEKPSIVVSAQAVPTASTAPTMLRMSYALSVDANATPAAGGGASQ